LFILSKYGQPHWRLNSGLLLAVLHRRPAPTIKKEQRPNKISHPFQKGNGRNSAIEKNSPVGI
jgi:hypothetical protein